MLIISKSAISSNDLEKRIINMLSKELMSTSELARKLGMRRDIIAGYLEALKNQGKLKFSKVGKSYVYTVTGGWRK